MIRLFLCLFKFHTVHLNKLLAISQIELLLEENICLIETVHFIMNHVSKLPKGYHS
jgi:hypothetical protein